MSDAESDANTITPATATTSTLNTPTTTTASQTMDSPMDPDSNSALSDEASFDTRSLHASVLDYPMFWGRRYHRYKEGSYLFPNDEDESTRLDDQHEILNRLHQRLFFAPLHPGHVRNVLDLGTGTGQWAIELADSNILPHAEITGIDLSAVQPIDVPSNVCFEIQDCSEDDWLRPLDSVDFCHARFLAGSLVSYRDMIRTARKYITPGTGWMEIQELHPTPVSDDDTIPERWPMKVWDDNLHRAAARALDPPRPVRVASHIKSWMEQAGFVDIHEHVSKIPMGSWPKDPHLKNIGGWWMNNWLTGLPGFTYKLFGVEGLQWTREEIEVMLADVRKAAKRKDIHAYQRHYIVYGRRPSKEEEASVWGDGHG